MLFKKENFFILEKVYNFIMYLILLIYSIYLSNKIDGLKFNIIMFVMFLILLIVVSINTKSIKDIFRYKRKNADIFFVLLAWVLFWTIHSIYQYISQIRWYPQFVNLLKSLGRKPTALTYHEYIYARDYYLVLSILFSINLLLLIINQFVFNDKKNIEKK